MKTRTMLCGRRGVVDRPFGKAPSANKSVCRLRPLRGLRCNLPARPGSCGARVAPGPQVRQRLNVQRTETLSPQRPPIKDAPPKEHEWTVGLVAAKAVVGLHHKEPGRDRELRGECPSQPSRGRQHLARAGFPQHRSRTLAGAEIGELWPLPVPPWGPSSPPAPRSPNKRVAGWGPSALRWKPSALSRLVRKHEPAPRLGFGNAWTFSEPRRFHWWPGSPEPGQLAEGQEPSVSCCPRGQEDGEGASPEVHSTSLLRGHATVDNSLKLIASRRRLGFS